jgi:MoxR-like ATPase
MSILDKVAQLKEFAAEPPEQVERELAALLRSEDISASRLNHVATTVLNRLSLVCAEASAAFEQRSTEIRMVAAGFVSGVPMLLLGPPGTAKSALVRRIAQMCGLSSGNEHNKQRDGYGGYFEYLLTNHTMPEELFGGPDLGALAKGKFKRITRSKLPEAEIAFLDEVFRGGGHILNTLLTIINEKRYDSGEGALHVPMLGLVGASNSAPLEQDLEAFFDRFPIRVWVQSVLELKRRHDAPDEEAARRLADYSVNAEVSRLIDAWDPQSAANERVAQQVSCTNDFRFLRIYLLFLLRNSKAATDRFNEFSRLFRMVRDKARLSDRSFGQLWLFGAAMDLLEGKNPLTSWQQEGRGHLDVFRYVARNGQDVASLNDRVTQHTNGLGHTGDL